MKEIMNQHFYSSPEIEMVEINEKQIICISAGTEKYSRQSWEQGYFE